jgi:hypothetical protein
MMTTFAALLGALPFARARDLRGGSPAALLRDRREPIGVEIPHALHDSVVHLALHHFSRCRAEKSYRARSKRRLITLLQPAQSEQVNEATRPNSAISY